MPKITVHVAVHAPIEIVWQYWNEPEHITKWCHASDDWHAPSAENTLEVGGRFKTVMAAKDGSVQFDFGGTYTVIEAHSTISYTMDDGRHVDITFESDGGDTTVTETFDPETENPEEMQRQGWQAILDNFKAYVEAHV